MDFNRISFSYPGGFTGDRVSTILTVECKTNAVYHISRSVDLVWIDGIEIPENQSWDELEYITICIGDCHHKIPIDIVRLMTKHQKKERFLRFPWLDWVKDYIPLVSYIFTETKIIIEAKSEILITLYMGGYFLGNDIRREIALERATMKIPFRSFWWTYYHRGKFYPYPVDKYKGIFIRSSDPIQKFNIQLKGQPETEYKVEQLQWGFQYTQSKKREIKEGMERLCIPYTLFQLIEQEMEELAMESWSWWWIPFEKDGSFWDWGNGVVIEEMTITLEPEPENARITFVHEEIINKY